MIGRLTIYAIHRTYDWWRHLAHHSGASEVAVLSDQRGRGGHSVTDDFYAALEQRGNSNPSLFDETETADIIARCRVLRWMPADQAERMVQAMAVAHSRALDRTQPDHLLSFPIDSYVSDTLSRLAWRRGIPHFEFTAGAIPDTGMLLHRGQLIQHQAPADPVLVGAATATLTAPMFTPTYVQGQGDYSRARWLRTFAYFQARGAAFKAYSHAKRDPLNLHYLDAQSFLGHKPRLSDHRIVDAVQPDWKARLERYPADRRLFIGLQLFPEAALDYWIDDPALFDQTRMVLSAVEAFTAAGWCVAIKDHPLQFGFRQMALIDALARNPHVILVPPDVPGAQVLELCSANLTGTGTLGQQAALHGKASIVAPSYYSNDDDFVVMRRGEDIAMLPEQTTAFQDGMFDLHERQQRIIRDLMRGTFTCDFFSFRGFRADAPSEGATATGRVLGQQIAALGKWGEQWHARTLCPAAPGS